MSENSDINVMDKTPEEFEKILPVGKFIFRRYEIENGIAKLIDTVYDIVEMENNSALTYEYGLNCLNVTLKMREK